MNKKKNEAREVRRAWAQAVREGRVVRLYDGLTFRSFHTLEERDEFLARLGPGLPATVSVVKEKTL